MPTPLNCTFDVYRGYNAANPYAPPNMPGAFCNLKGTIKQHVRNGRFGYYGGVQANALLHWTTVLLVPITDDIRDAYNTQLNADVIANGDTVMMQDYPTEGTCCAFVVVMAQRVGRGTPGDYLRLYLDRALPTYGAGCPNCQGAAPPNTLCCSDVIPDTLVATVVNVSGLCSCFNQTVTLTKNPTPIFDGFNNVYHWYGTFSCGANTVELNLFCGGSGGSSYRWLLSLTCNGVQSYSLGDTANSHAGYTATRSPSISAWEH